MCNLWTELKATTNHSFVACSSQHWKSLQTLCCSSFLCYLYRENVKEGRQIIDCCWFLVFLKTNNLIFKGIVCSLLVLKMSQNNYTRVILFRCVVTYSVEPNWLGKFTRMPLSTHSNNSEVIWRWNIAVKSKHWVDCRTLYRSHVLYLHCIVLLSLKYHAGVHAAPIFRHKHTEVGRTTS